MQATARADFGAIAYSSSVGSYGTSYGFKTRGGAEAEARGGCGQSDCQIVVWVSNSCGAFAVSADGATGWAVNSVQGIAENAALNNCSAGGSRCSILAWTCSG